MSHVRRGLPGVRVHESVLRAYVAERLGDAEPSEAILEALHLACGCARGDLGALRAFEETYVPDMTRALARLRLRPADVADVMQSLREQLLVGKDEQPPRIVEYSGRGDLAGWLRVTAVRAGLKKLRGKKPEVDVDDAQLAARSIGDDPELSYMKESYRRVFRESFTAVLAQLDPREKNLLHQHFVDGLSVSELGGLYGTHRATAARWVQRARDHLLDETKKEFSKRAKLSPRECASVLRLVRSRLDVTLSGLLAG